MYFENKIPQMLNTHKKLFFKWKRLQRNLSSAAAPGAGRRATNQPLSFRLTLLFILCGLALRPSQLRRELAVSLKTCWWLVPFFVFLDTLMCAAWWAQRHRKDGAPEKAGAHKSTLVCVWFACLLYLLLFFFLALTHSWSACNPAARSYFLRAAVSLINT